MKKMLLLVLVAACACKTTDGLAQATNVQDSLALVDLYDSCGGINWVNAWDLNMQVSTWNGITAAGRITGINLYAQQLSGKVPSSIGNLSELTYLNLAFNYQVTGTIPVSIANLVNLTYLDLAYNKFSGEIPPALSDLSNLTDLKLEANLLTGGIPSSLGNLSNLTDLELDDNQLSGGIPSSLGNLSNLISLDLDDDQLSGSIPSSLGNLPNLSNLELDFNSLSGSIPSQLGNLTNLSTLYLEYNQLSGNIPSTLGNLASLTNLELNNNELSGSIPASFGNLSNLSDLQLDNNQLSGTIPSSLDSIANFFLLYLNNNQFTFAGMEGIVSSYKNISYLEYAPQANISLHYSTGELSVSAGGILSNNTYNWHNGTALIATNVGDSTLTVKENGNYSVAVTNSIVTLAGSYTDLILYSDTVTISSLPIKLLSFTATKQASQNLLQWATSQEINSSYFAVQRSSDGSNFTTLGKVNATGNSSATHNYTFTDTKPASGTNYYRLKMVDKDGKFTYSPIRIINETASFAANIYPNPVQNNLNLNFNSGKAITVQVEIVDNGGKVVVTQQVQIAAGASTQIINTASLSNGTYYVRCITTDGETELKFMKEIKK